MFCANCETKLEDGDAFCPECGTRAQDTGNPAEPVWNLQGAPAKAVGGLRIWLWLSVAVCILVLISDVVILARLGGYLDGLYISVLLASMGLTVAQIVGVLRLLKGHRHGFYVICVCAGLVFLLNVSVLNASLPTALLGLASPVIVWLFARKQWQNFW